MKSSMLSFLEIPMPNSTPNSNPIPAFSPSPKSELNPCKSTRGESKSVQYRGVWLKRARDNKGKKKEARERFVSEIAYQTKEEARRKIWLGTYGTPTGAALAYDLPTFKIKKNTLNYRLSENGEIRALVPPERQDSIKKEVNKLIAEKYLGDSFNQVGKNMSGTKKNIPEGSETTSQSGSQEAMKRRCRR